MYVSSLSNSRTRHRRASHARLVTVRASGINLLILKVNCRPTLRTKEVLRRKPQFLHQRAPHQCKLTLLKAKTHRCIGRLRASWLKQTRRSRTTGERPQRLISEETTSLGILRAKARFLRLKKSDFQKALSTLAPKVQILRPHMVQGQAMARPARSLICSII